MSKLDILNRSYCFVPKKLKYVHKQSTHCRMNEQLYRLIVVSRKILPLGLFMLLTPLSKDRVTNF